MNRGDGDAGFAAVRRAPATGAAPAVVVRGVEMDFGSGPLAVRDASFTLDAGRFLTILGPSGSGKTTLLRLIAGFLRPTRGEITVSGVRVGDVPPHRRSVGMVFQRLALFPHMTAAENVAFPLKMRRYDPAAIPGRVADYLDLVRLGGFGDRRIHELSGGQQQRVAIARALVFEPDLLLLDEPLAALDRKLREEMQLEFRRIQRELGVTTINVTHDQREALVVSDELIVMDHGEIQQAARPADLYLNPANPFVAGFIGTTSFVDGLMRGGGLEVEGMLCAGRPVARVEEGRQARGAIRAERVRLARDADALAGCDARLAATVEDVIFEGERVVYVVRVPALGGPELSIYHHDPETLDFFEAGAEVAVGWAARDLLIFARTDGQTEDQQGGMT